jgi:hypothetical protein
VPVKLHTPHELLIFLVDLSNDPAHSWKLNSGEQVIREAIDRGLMEWEQQQLDAFARLLFALGDDGSITFADYAGQHRHGSSEWVGYNDAAQAARITVTSTGRMAVASSRPSITIGQLALGSIANIAEMSVLVAQVERALDEASAPEETKQEAQSRLRRLADTASEVGTGAAGELLASVLRQVGGLP